MSLDVVNNNTPYIDAAVGSVLKTTNQGVNWSTFITKTSSTIYDIDFVNSNTGYIFGSYGIILKTTTGSEPIAVKQISVEMPKKFILEQNYPNPFNPSTKIKFSIPYSPFEGGKGDVKLVVFNILGQQIAALVNQQLSPGTYEVEWPASNFSSGIYFYKLTAGDYYETKKMVLMK
jgi:hypothetical protein